MSKGALGAAVVALMFGLITGPSWGASRLFDDPSGEVTGSPIGEGGGQALTPAMIRDLRFQAHQMEIERVKERKLLAQPSRVAERQESRTAFADIGPGASRRLVAQQFQPFVAHPSAGPLSSGERADKYVGQFSARLEGDAPGGEDAFVVSGHPLRMRDESGELAPVDLTLTADSDGWRPKNPLQRYAIDADGDLRFEDEATGIGVDVKGNSSGERLQETIFYADTETDTDTLVKPRLDGVQYAWQLRSAASPESLVMDMQLPAGATLGKVTAQGVNIISDGDVIGRVSPAIALDADHQPVPANLRVEGDRIFVDVDHRDRDVAYPILVDPEVVAGFFFHYQGDEATNWPYWETYDNGRMDTWGGSGQWGKGLYLLSQNYPSYISFYPGSGLADSEQAGHVYNAPGQARIYKVYNTVSRNITGETLAVCMLVGIAHAYPGGFGGPYGQTYGEGCTPFGSYGWTVQTPNGAATNGNRFIFGAYTYSAKLTAFLMYFQDAEIRMYDEDSPTVTQVNAPTDEWLDGHHTGGLRAYATDPSTGVKWLTFAAPNGWSRTVTNQRCAFGPCTRTWDNGDTSNGQTPQYVPVSQIPEGRYDVGAYAQDPAGNASAVAHVPVKVDRSAPEIELGGSLYAARDASVPADILELAATAHDGIAGSPMTERAGVVKLELLVDGVLREVTTQQCFAGNCAMSRTFPVDTGMMAPGPRVFTIRATDALGQSRDSSFVVTLAPQFQERDPLEAAPGPEPDLGAPLDVEQCPEVPPASGPCAEDSDNPSLQAALSEPPLAQTPFAFSLSAALTSGQYGLANQRANFAFDNDYTSYFQALRNAGLNRIRTTVPWDFVARTAGGELTAPYTDEKERFNNLYSLTNSGLQLLVSFEKRRGIIPDRKLPTREQYRTAINAFRDEYPNVTEFIAWNEPNHPTQPTRGLEVVNGAARMEWAGRYWAILREECDIDRPGDARPCTAVAGEFIDRTDLTAADLQHYFAGMLETSKPARVWAFHPYRAGRYRTAAPLDSFLKKITKQSTIGWRKPIVWLTEQGGLVCIKGQEQSLANANGDLQYLLGLPQNATRSQITRFYAYQWVGDPIPGCGAEEFDSGLMDVHTKQPRSMYTTFLNRVSGAG